MRRCRRTTLVALTIPPARSHAAVRDRFSSVHARRRGWNAGCRSTMRQSHRRPAFRRRRHRTARQMDQLVDIEKSRRREAHRTTNDELTLGGSMRTPVATGRVGPHAALSGLTQRTASAVFGAVRHFASGAAAADSPDSFVGVEVDDHDCKARGMRTRSHGPKPPAGSPPDAAEGPSSGSELDLPGFPPVTRTPSTPGSATAPVAVAASAGRGPGRSGTQAAASGPSAAPLDTRAGAPGGGGGLANGAEVPLALRTVLAAERANDLSVQQFRMQHEASQRALKSEKDASDRHDTHDMKVPRMLVNDCSASYTPPVAESESPSADTRMLTSQWLPTVKRRVVDAVTRAEMYGILFVPTSRILKYSAKCRFGRNGLHPDLFKTYTFENASTMAPLDADVDALDKPLTSNDLSNTLVVLASAASKW